MLQFAARADPPGPAFFFFCSLRHFALIFRWREARCFSTGKDGCFASEGFSRQLPWQLLPTHLQQGWSGASLVSFLYPVLKLAKNRRTGASLDFLPRTSLPLPLKGEGLAIVFLGVVEFALLVYNRLTRLQQGLFGASLVSFPYAAFKTGHRATQGRVWVHHFFLERFCPGRTAKSRSSL